MMALRWISELNIPRGERVLEAGCGAGFMAVSLAQSGYRVDAVDASSRMIGLTSERARNLGLDSQITAAPADVHRLSFEDETFTLVVALGLVPWLYSPQLALQEVARVLRPGGYLLVNADNRWRLSYLLDPLHNPAAKAVARALAALLRRLGLLGPRRSPMVRTHTAREFDRMLQKAGLTKARTTTLGFGPLSLFGKCVLPNSFSIALHATLQSLADQGVRAVRSAGSQYLVLAVKPPRP